MTTAERAAVLDEQLRRGYEKFDGIVLGERRRTQAEAEAAGLGGLAGGDDAGGGGGGAAGQPQTMPPNGQVNGPGGAIPTSSASPPPPAESFPPPEDIPSGRDDDVVARQLREAAMREPDPELRERLWDEYRKYTGISEKQ